MTFRLFYIIAFTFFGCAYVPKTNLDAFADISIQYSKCNKIPGKIAVAPVRFDLEDLSRGDITGKDKADNRKEYFFAERLLLEIEKRGVIETNQEALPKYIFGFALNIKHDYFLLPLLSAFTWGILPIKQNGEIWMNVRVFEPSGKLIYDANSIKLEHSSYGGWFAVLFGFVGILMQPPDFYEKVTPIMINDLVNAMAKNNILDCEK